MSWLVGAPLKANTGEPLGILQMLAVLISNTETTTKAKTQTRDTNEKIEKTTEMCSIIKSSSTKIKCREKEW